MIQEEYLYHEASNTTEAFLDCARYNETDDAATLRLILTSSPQLIEATDHQGRTAIHLAAANGHMEILKILLEFGARPDIANHEGNTALHFAALNNQIKAAKFLLSCGWQASARNVFDKTPIQLIYGKRFEEMETLLLEYDEEMEKYVQSVVGIVENEQNNNNNNNNNNINATSETENNTLESSDNNPNFYQQQNLELSSFSSSTPATADSRGVETTTIKEKHDNPQILLGTANVDEIE